jgi:hypothetical protein
MFVSFQILNHSTILVVYASVSKLMFSDSFEMLVHCLCLLSGPLITMPVCQLSITDLLSPPAFRPRITVSALVVNYCICVREILCLRP